LNIRKKLSAFLLMAILIFTGCSRPFEGDKYVSALLDAVCKRSYSEYSVLTGVPTARVSSSQSLWLKTRAEAFTDIFTAGECSEETSDRIEKFLKMAYSMADYEVLTQTPEAESESEEIIWDTAANSRNTFGSIPDESGESLEEGPTVYVKIKPLLLLAGSREEILTYTETFNEANENFEYAQLSDTSYNDTYLAGIMNILESKLSDPGYSTPVILEAHTTKTPEGLYEISPGDLDLIISAVLPFPDFD